MHGSERPRKPAKNPELRYIVAGKRLQRLESHLSVIMEKFPTNEILKHVRVCDTYRYSERISSANARKSVNYLREVVKSIADSNILFARAVKSMERDPSLPEALLKRYIVELKMLENQFLTIDKAIMETEAAITQRKRN